LVSTPQQPAASTQAVAAAAPAAPPTTVYKDDTTQITATPMSNGMVMLKAVATGGDKCDPVLCSTQGIR
jgi:hypothetical protein